MKRKFLGWSLIVLPIAVVVLCLARSQSYDFFAATCVATAIVIIVFFSVLLISAGIRVLNTTSNEKK